ncbi:MAG: TIR domain-containing protein [Blastocatellia bacterium]
MGKVFISYSHDGKTDTRLAEFLHEAINGRGHDAFIYKKEIPLSVQWSKLIDQRLDECDLFILLLSENSSKSDYVAEEVDRAYSLNQKHGRPAIASVRVKFEGDPPDDPLAIGRLKAAGLVRTENRTFVPANQLYARYFRRMLEKAL